MRLLPLFCGGPDVSRSPRLRLSITYPMTVVDAVFKALAPAIPDRVMQLQRHV